MQGVFSGGTASAAKPAGVPILGKTGTTNKSLETWTVGSSTKVATAVWIGNATGQVPTRNTRPPVHCPGTANQVATLRNCVFKHTMEAIDAVYGSGAFPAASAQYLNGTTTPLPSFAGQTVTAATAQLQALGYTVTVAPGEVASAQPEGTVDSTSPPAGTRLSSGYDITINVSDGSLAKKVPNVTGETLMKATQDIEDAGFVTPTSTCTADATIILPNMTKVTSTNPIAGWQGPASTKVNISYSKQTCP
jgi:membrane peptidoglycan carboxypeptidase